MQWLIAPKDNARIQARWGDLFPNLGADEALLEGAYTGDAYRGQGIMAHAMSRIAEAAGAFGARWVQTFVGHNNIASLKGCKKAGFTLFQRRSEVWRLLRRTVEFTRVPEGTPYPFDVEPQPQQQGAAGNHPPRSEHVARAGSGRVTVETVMCTGES